MNSFKNIFLFVILLASIFIIGCTGESKPETSIPTTPSSSPVTETKKAPKQQKPAPNMDKDGINYSVAAQEICSCTKDATIVMTEIGSVDPQTDKDKYDALTTKISSKMKEAIKCAQVKKSEMTSRSLDKKMLAEAFKKDCPDMNQSLMIQTLVKINQGMVQE